MGATFDETTGIAEITCDVCTGLITHSDEYGMHCAKECTRQEDIDALEGFIDTLKGLSK